ncbi:MAG TPA: 3-deoxy-D-manno-octulosonic acid kinase [Steroidobacteraceae bacterium]|jgi:3-deoxy-D-manno-octulosonic acid kinase
MRKSLIWPTGAEVRQIEIRGGAMLYDTSKAGNAAANWFDPGWWARRGQVREAPEGRGSTLFIDADDRQLVLRHYRRGGWAARLFSDRYWWQAESLTRSFVEWHMLYVMRRAGLAVPRPIAACYRRTGRYSYCADLLTERIPEVSSLAARLQAGALPLSHWIALGKALRRFHKDGVFHADLNAHNVLISDEREVWLVDFDRGRLRKPGLWCDSNIVRLRRSIEKIADPLPPEHFSEADWASLLSGYFVKARRRAEAA